MNESSSFITLQTKRSYLLLVEWFIYQPKLQRSCMTEVLHFQFQTRGWYVNFLNNGFAFLLGTVCGM